MKQMNPVLFQVAWASPTEVVVKIARRNGATLESSAPSTQRLAVWVSFVRTSQPVYPKNFSFCNNQTWHKR